MTRTKVEKVLSGNYQIGRYSIFRITSGAWSLVGPLGILTTEVSQKLAVIAARIYLNEATEAEIAEYRAAANQKEV